MSLGTSAAPARVAITFEDVALYFSEQEWEILDEEQQDIYQQVMRTNYETLISLGCAISKPDLITWIEQGRILFIGAQEPLEKVSRTLGPCAEEQLDLECVQESPPAAGDMAALGPQDDVLQGGLRELDWCAALSGQVRTALSSALPRSQETGTLSKDPDTPATANLPENYLHQEPLVTPDHQKFPGGPLCPCSVCREGSQAQESLVVHQRNHPQWPITTFPKCQNVAIRNGELARPQGGKYALATLRAAHSGRQPFRCPECGRSFHYQGTWRRHLCLPRGATPLCCPECSRAFLQQHQLAEHRRVHAGEQPFQCAGCGRRFLLQRSLKEHLCERRLPQQAPGAGQRALTRDGFKRTVAHATTPAAAAVRPGKEPLPGAEAMPDSAGQAPQRTPGAEKRHPCGVCGKGFSRPSKLTRHLRAHGRRRSEFSCDHCGKTFPRMARLAQHRQVHLQEKPFPCAECGRRFSRSAHLCEHARLHAGAPLQCPECGRRFLWRTSLRLHLRRHQGKPFACSECGQGCAQRAQLAEHLRIHSGEKPFWCPECDKSFRLKGHLKSHLLQHSDRKPYSCGKCGKSFSQPYRLTEHAHVHSGDKPYQCPECGKDYCTRASLKAHLHTHSGQKPFGCPECGKGFLQKRSLKMHLHRHRLDRPFSCAECGRSFTYTGALNTHVAAVHARQPALTVEGH